MNKIVNTLKSIEISSRVQQLRESMFNEKRYMSVEQAGIITKVYSMYKHEPIILKRAHALASSLREMSIRIDPKELIVGNRTKESCGGVVFPEGGITWVENEIDDFETRPQDKFIVREEDKKFLSEYVFPFWTDNTLESEINSQLSDEMKACEIVGKLNQKDHAQGHICPDTEKWITTGPVGLIKEIYARLDNDNTIEQSQYYEASIIVLQASIDFISRYAALAKEYADNEKDASIKQDYLKVYEVCNTLAHGPATSFHEAVQALWFLIVILEMESNASSFSPGRADQYLLPFFLRDIENKTLTYEKGQELVDLMFIKFNQIVYFRNTKGAEFFAGFPIGFNISIGGQLVDGRDGTNELTYMFLRAQEHVQLRQPNLSARVYRHSPELYLERIAEVVGIGTGMPQVVNDESIVPALEGAGYEHEDAMDYVVVGCVELSVPGKALGFSDAAMFNMVKVLELTLNNGVDVRTGKQIGLELGALPDFRTYEELEQAFSKQLDYFVGVMDKGLHIIEKYHKEMMPSPFLSSVIDSCIDRGVDVTSGGATYNKSGIQLIQIANLADSLAALKALVYDEKRVSPQTLMIQLKENYSDDSIRQLLLHRAPKYGNDVRWVDEIGNKWIKYLKNKLDGYKNYRGGNYTIGLYTVSAHVPMGKNVGATPDGRRAGDPLADGGMSAVYGRDQNGPTALLQSVSRVDSMLASNGTLLNMKFSPSFFSEKEGIQKFVFLLKGFIELKITHVQFNVVNKQDLIDAMDNPENYRHLLVRVAGYTANFVDLSSSLQNEIIKRTEFGG